MSSHWIVTADGMPHYLSGYDMAQNKYSIEVIAPAKLFGTVRVGMPGQVSLAPFFPGTHQAKVVVVDKVIDAASGTMGVRLQLPNPDNKIPAGIKCSVVIGK